MTTHFPHCRLLVSLALFVLPATAAGQAPDSTLPGRFDLGKMWTFENPPTEYFSSTYGFTADSAWFARARLAALRIPGCSAGLVSPNGLIVTNHHCVRSRLASIARPGETLLDSGFVARDLADERPIPGFFADQLLAALDVSQELEAAGSGTALREAVGRIGDRLMAEYHTPSDSIVIQFVSLYDGARTSAYVFRRLTDIRFVAAVELQMGFFGGDPDNFTYPRYALDFAVLRAYGPDGKPLSTPAHFGWGGGGTGVQPGDVVFVIGNPGRTSRLTTIAQLEYLRDVAVPVSLGFHRTRLAAMQAYREADPVAAEAIDIRNRMFSLSNREKSLGGRSLALRDATIMTRRGGSERMLRDSLRTRPELQQRYGGLFDALSKVQQARRAQAGATAAFSELLNRTAGSGLLQRAFWAWRLATGPADSSAVFQRAYTQSPSWPAELERRFLALQLADIAAGYGEHAITRAVLGGDSAEATADRLMRTSTLAGANAPDPGPLAEDPAVGLMRTLGPAILGYQKEEARLAAEESALAADIGRARYAVYGAAIPPDGSSSPRIADGVVQGYSYNGTLAPPWTTFYGIYDRYSAFGPGTDWELPYRWRTPPVGLDLGTPLNFVSTADSYGGNSGSPAVTRDLRLVGLNFDRNINALVRDYLYLPERGRNVMVDARAIEAALDVVYDLDRVVLELRTGRLVATEAEADRIP
jgi:hypothetical protein